MNDNRLEDGHCATRADGSWIPHELETVTAEGNYSLIRCVVCGKTKINHNKTNHTPAIPSDEVIITRTPYKDQ